MYILNQKSIENVLVSRNGDTLIIEIMCSAKDKVDIYMGAYPNYEKIKEKIISSIGNKFKLDLPAKKGPYYFYYSINNKKSYIFSERVIPLEGAINIRDMGGYSTKDGRYVKWGKLYRGDQLSNLTTCDLDILSRIGIKSIIDYRSTLEMKKSPNKKIKTVENVINCNPNHEFSEVAAQAVDLNDENRRLIKELEENKIPDMYINGEGKKVIESYQGFVSEPNSQQAYTKVLNTIKDYSNAPILHHCRGGKDRTGFGAMLMLMLLGVEEEMVIYDYILTGELRKDRNEFKLSQYKKLTSNSQYLAYLMSLIETRDTFILASIEKIKLMYGNVENYAKECLGISSKDIAQMKKDYLEEVID